MQQYYSDQVIISWIAVPLNEGLAQGTFLSFSDEGPTWTWVKDGLGGGIRLYNDDNSGIVAFVLETSSVSHQSLLALARLDRITKDVKGAFVAKDLSSGQAFTCSNAYIIGEPTEVRGSEASVATWDLQYENRQIIPSPVNLNTIP